jgi:hypothetical protein
MFCTNGCLIIIAAIRKAGIANNIFLSSVNEVSKFDIENKAFYNYQLAAYINVLHA